VDFVKNVTQLTIGFNATSKTYFPVRGATWSMRTFSGSAFALPVHQTIKFLQVADVFMKKHELSGDSALRFYVMSEVQPPTADPPGLLLPVSHRIDRKPYAAVFDSTGNAKIQLGILEAAGLERELRDTCGDKACPLNQTVLTPGAHYRILNKDDAGAIDDKVCLSFASEPHFAGSKEPGGALPFVNAARKFVLSGGNFLAQCHGIDTYESCDLMKSSGKTCPNGGTISQTGMAQDGSPYACRTEKTTEIYPSGADLPVVQFEGPWSQIGGSVTALCDGTGNHTKFYNEPTGRYGFWVHGYQGATPAARSYHVASGSSNRSEPIGYRYFFLTGHSYNPSEAGARVYLNALLIPANRRKACGFVIEEQFIARKRQTGAIKSTSQPGDFCGCNVVFDACGVCNGNGKKGIDGCGVCDGDGKYIDYCGTCRKNAPFRFPDNSTDIGCCGDGIVNQNEENVDCGGVCGPCTPMPTPVPTPVGATPSPTPTGGTPQPAPVGGTPFPTPVGGNNPSPTPVNGGGSGAACDLFEFCGTCVGHPLRSCTWCGSACQANPVCDDGLVVVPSRGNCTAVFASTTTTVTAAPSPTAAPGPSPTPQPEPPADGSCFPGQVAGDSIFVGKDTCVCTGARLLCFKRTSELLPVDGGCFSELSATGSLAYIYDDPKPFCSCLTQGLFCTSSGLSCGLLTFSKGECDQRKDCVWRDSSAGGGKVCVASDLAPTSTGVGMTTRDPEEIKISAAETITACMAMLVAWFFATTL
jgi:hypothetical protein